ncbi:MAG: PHB depolymerase family esterase [Acidimicrobiales bacterium]
MTGDVLDIEGLRVLCFAVVTRRGGGRNGLLVVLALSIVVSACSSSPARQGAPTTSAHHVATGTSSASTGCATSAAPAASELLQKITVDGAKRLYLLTAPPVHRGDRLPVVVDLHGLSEGAALEAITTQFSPKAIADRFIVVFPQGTGNPVGWDIQPATSGHPNHDIDFMNALLNTLEAQRCVDASRIYATGLSDGALFTSLLACTMANRFAAFAPVAGVVVPQPCQPAHPVPILAFHGTADPILPFNGGTPGTTAPPVNLFGPGYPANVQAWAVKDGCNPTPTDTQVATHVILRTYPCPPGAAVEFYIVVGGGHAWPGSTISAMNGPSTFEINATDLIWAFFRHYRLT